MATSTETQRPARRRWRWIAAGIVVIVAAIGLAVGVARGQDGAASAPSTTVVDRGEMVATVAGSGTITAEQTVDFTFQSGGTVTEVLVEAGDTIEAGEVLANLDDRHLALQVENAEANLASARARLRQMEEGSGSAAEIAAAEAQVAAAEANYRKVTTGPTAAEIAAAEAEVESAQAAYDAAVQAAGASKSELEAARAAMEKAAVAVQSAQAAYDRVAWMPGIAARPESVQLQNATIEYEQARANHEALASTVESDDASRVQSAEAQLQQARSNLETVRNSVDGQDVAAAQAEIDQARANLESLRAPAGARDLEIQRAAVKQAEVALEQAKLDLEAATLVAPFDGVVTAVSVVPGSVVAASAPIITLVDRSVLHVELRLNESDVTQVELDQRVTIGIDSLPGWSREGKVSYIAPAAEIVNDVVTYPVRITFPDDDPAVKVGMTANLNIVTARKKDVLRVPNSALLPKGAGYVVQVPDGSGATTQEVEVEVGLSDGLHTEVLDGVSEGDRVITVPADSDLLRRNDPFGN